MASAPDVYVVRVGNRDDALIFDPPEIMVGYGGTIQFQFLSVNHSISQSDFANPCAPLPGGFFFWIHRPHRRREGQEFGT